MSDVAIRIEGISKRYALGSARPLHDTLRDLLSDRIRGFWRPRKSVPQDTTFWALRDVSFEVRRGDTVGLIGRNGAGKSTLLKILTRITEPTAGRAEIRGRVGSLLEVGTGFDAELSGRENIFLSGAILGMRRAEISRRFDEIVAFSEIEQFLDTPVKRYSSGMYVRLGFAVAAHLESEVLLVDEVLAVGDAAFQQKCLGKMQSAAQSDRTVVFVSHNMAAVTRLCRWGVWIDAGSVREIGPATDVAMHYLQVGQEDVAEVTFPDESGATPGSEFIRVVAVRARDGSGRVVSAFRSGESQTLEIEYDVLRTSSNLRVGIKLVAGDGTDVFTSRDTDMDPEIRSKTAGRYVSHCTIPSGLLRRGQYLVSFGCDTPKVRVHFFLERALGFRVEDVVGEGDSLPDGGKGSLRILLPWASHRVA